MDSSGMFCSRYLRLGLIGILVAGGGWDGSFGQGRAGAGSAMPAQTRVIPPLSANDVSFLFPAPNFEPRILPI